jgi:hypothetical protein
VRTLPLSVLVAEGPIARAYLERMRQQGLRPSRIVLMVWSHHPASGKRLGRWLPPSLRLAFAARHQEAAYNHWPREFLRKQPALVDAILEGVSALSSGARELVSNSFGSFDYGRYSPSVERVLVRDLRDPALLERFSHGSPETVLFTGGGIVPKALLELPGIRFLHVHPGYLPHVRGADGALWSTLVRGRPGASCFYMAPGIDTGEIVAAREFEPLAFNLPPGARPDDQTLYRALFSFCDPLLRAELLAEVLERSDGEPSQLVAQAQDTGAGLTYHFMHERLRAAALQRLFSSRLPAG